MDLGEALGLGFGTQSRVTPIRAGQQKAATKGSLIVSRSPSMRCVHGLIPGPRPKLKPQLPQATLRRKPQRLTPNEM